METELILSVSASHLQKVTSQLLMQQFASAEPTLQRLVSHYFDTQQSSLWRKGMSLRVRQEEGQALQRLKRDPTDALQYGARKRGEWETVVATPVPDLRALARLGAMPRRHAKLLRRLRRLRHSQALTERFVVQVERTALLLEIDGAQVEMALDEGKVTAAAASASFCEIKLSLRSGNTTALYAAARHLAHHLPVQRSFVSKAAHGYALIAQAGQPARARPIVFPDGASVEQGMRYIFAACLVHAQTNAHGFLFTDDGEYLHQMRVGMRRFKSALKLFGDVVVLPEALRQELDTVSALLGAARDADVLLSSTLAGLNGNEERRAHFQPLLEHATADAVAKRSAARAAIQSTKHAQWMLALFEWVDCKGWRQDMSQHDRQRLRAPLQPYARHAVIAAHAQVQRRARKVGAQARTGEAGSKSLHRLRIAGKQSRYAVEFFEDMERPGPAAKYVKQLAGVQDALGAINDIHVAQAALAGFAAADASLRGPVEELADQLDGVIAGTLAARRTPWRKLGKASALAAVKRLVR